MNKTKKNIQSSTLTFFNYIYFIKKLKNFFVNVETYKCFIFQKLNKQSGQHKLFFSFFVKFIFKKPSTLFRNFLI